MTAPDLTDLDDPSPADVRRVSVLLGLLFGLAGMGSAATAMALAPLAEAYDVSMGAAAWSISLYALMLGVGTAVYGRVADLQGPRFPMMVGLSLMTFGALVAALSPTFEMHLAGRLFQGAGAAAVPTLGAAVVSARYAGEVKSSALMRLAATSAAVTSLGPLAGGVLVDTLSWRFTIALPILGVLVIPLLWSTLHVGGTGAKLDLLGAFLTALAAGGVVLLLQSPVDGHGGRAGRAAAGAARHARRRGLGAAPAARLPAVGGDPQRHRGAQRRWRPRRSRRRGSRCSSPSRRCCCGSAGSRGRSDSGCCPPAWSRW